jgi:hypothetical protein
MRTEQVTLRHLQGGAPVVVALREPLGEDEIAVEGVDTLCAVALLGRLLGEAPLDAGRLAAADRDALLAALHRQCWGDRITSTLACAACAQRFDISFKLSDAQRHLGTASASPAPFTVPSAEEEMAAAAHGAREGALRLAEACGARAEDFERASDALAAAAPIVDFELAARCAECGHEQAAHFDLQSFLLQRLLNERPALLAEIHALAAGYGWSLAEILSLGRSTRRAMTAILDKASRG